MLTISLENKLVMFSLVALIAALLGTVDLKAEEQSDSPGIGIISKESMAIEQKSAEAKEKIEGVKTPYTLWYNSDEWKLLDQNINPIAEFSFEMKNGNSFAMVLPEDAPANLDLVPDIIIDNATKNDVKNAKILKTEKRVVNGAELLFVKWSGEIKGMTFVYFIYVFSGDKNTVQVVGYTLDSTADKLEGDIMEFLNGLTVKPKEQPLESKEQSLESKE